MDGKRTTAVIQGEIKDADLKLIAAAPTMFEALQDARDALVMLELIDKSDMTRDVLVIVEYAIKQAKIQ
jgi:hypothetical protein